MSQQSNASFGERLARFEEWRQVHERDHDSIVKDIDQLRAEMIRRFESSRRITDKAGEELDAWITDSMNKIDARLSEIEKWQNNLNGRFWMLGAVMTFVNAVMVFFIRVLFK